MDYAWLAPALCAAAFFVNVLISRQLGAAKHRVAGVISLAAIFSAFAIFLVVFVDALPNLGGADSHSAGGAASALGTPNHLLFEDEPWFSIGQYEFHGTMVVDWVSVMMLGVVTFLSSLIQLYAVGYMKGDNRFWWFFSVMSLFSAAMLALVLASNFLLMYMAWELVGLCSYLLIGFWYQERDNAEAAKKAFVTTRIGDVGFMIGIALLFIQTGTFQMEEIFAAVQGGRIDPTVVTIAGILVFAGAMGKSGQFPLHVWLPDAMAGPTPVSALVHSATMVAAGVYLVGRAYPLFAASPITMGVIAVIGTITAIFAATIALTQRDIKRILAYSTVSQLGYMMMALGVGAYSAGLFHLYTHAFFKALLFLGAGSVIHAMEPLLHGTGRNPNDIFNMGGLRKYMPITFWTFLIASLSLAGIFPLSGFWSKDAILAGTVNAGAWLSFIVGVVTAFLTAFYMFRAIYLTFFGEPRYRLAAAAAGGAVDTPVAGAREAHATAGGHGHGAAPHESPWVMTLPLVLIAVPAAIAGWIGIPDVFDPFAAAIFFEEHHAEHLNLWIALAGTLAGLLGIGLATVMYWKPVISPRAIGDAVPVAYRTLYNKYYFDEMYQWVIDRIILGLAGLAATFDRKVISDNVSDRPAYATAAAGGWLRLIENGKVYSYALAFIVGIVLVVGVMTLWSSFNIRANLW